MITFKSRTAGWSLCLAAAFIGLAARASAQDNSVVISCIEEAARTRLGDRGGAILCRDARSSGPVLCYKAGQARTSLTDPQMIGLCRCARDEGPVDCYKRARRDTGLLDPDIVRQCSAIVADHLLQNCRPAPE